MLELDLMFGLVMLPLFLQTLQIAEFDGFALAVSQIACFRTLAIPTFLHFGLFGRHLHFASDDISVSFAKRIYFLKTLSLSNRLIALAIEIANLSSPPLHSQLIAQSLPIFLFGDLHKHKVELVRFILF